MDLGVVTLDRTRFCTAGLSGVYDVQRLRHASNSRNIIDGSADRNSVSRIASLQRIVCRGGSAKLRPILDRYGRRHLRREAAGENGATTGTVKASEVKDGKNDVKEVEVAATTSASESVESGSHLSDGKVPSGEILVSSVEVREEKKSEESNEVLASVSTSSAAKTSVSTPATKPTKDALALKALDAYFDQLRPPSAESTSSKESTFQSEQKAPSKVNDVQSDALDEINDIETLKEELMKALNNSGSSREDVKRVLSRTGLSDDDVKLTVEVGGLSDFDVWILDQQEKSPPFVLAVILAINIAVFLFELASPEAIPGNIVTSLPSLYGAKVNSLIDAGEWWRLISPIFLHAGFFHIVISSLVLCSIGPAIEVAFGPLGFLAAYVTSGIFGNMFSYLITPMVTIGGTGPLYGLVGAWMVYVLKNREVIGHPAADGIIISYSFFAVLNVVLGSSLPIDDWTHIGAFIGGAFFALLAAPKLELNDDGTPNADTGSKEQTSKSILISVIGSIINDGKDYKPQFRSEELEPTKVGLSVLASMALLAAIWFVGLHTGNASDFVPGMTLPDDFLL
eukprot:TRINITY_DN12693_c0_g1_i4.p1 TRINITY_DN12693_c0_g1~~TRINITY_DN12693_c0_g1_i4.p1  ORF type:complete len:568 (+),score=104.32 TRINITY_DN12693_c0_g1_i4:175-1878(+)